MDLLSEDIITIKSNTMTTEFYTISLNDYGIIEVKWNPDLEEVDIIHLKHLRNSIETLSKGKKMLIYLDTYNFMAITPEARKYTTTEEASEYSLANAVLIDSLPKKLIFNFYLKINTPLVETKGFNSKEEAMKWLTQFQK